MSDQDDFKLHVFKSQNGKKYRFAFFHAGIDPWDRNHPFDWFAVGLEKGMCVPRYVVNGKIDWKKKFMNLGKGSVKIPEDFIEHCNRFLKLRSFE